MNDWEISYNEVSINYDKCLGSGEYGQVYMAKWRGTTVAIKIFKNLPEEKSFLIIREFETMTKLHHPNIIQLLGYINSPFCLIMEYIDNGNLDDYIYNKNHSIRCKLKISLEILKGLTYIHERKPSYVIHRDIKPSNILFVDDTVKICDFGLARNVNSEINLINGSSEVGTSFYRAPEIDSHNYNNKIDVYSLGIILIELLLQNFKTQAEKMAEQEPHRTPPPTSQDRIQPPPSPTPPQPPPPSSVPRRASPPPPAPPSADVPRARSAAPARCVAHPRWPSAAVRRAMRKCWAVQQ
jgi:serine/threonine protein kinase